MSWQAEASLTTPDKWQAHSNVRFLPHSEQLYVRKISIIENLLQCPNNPCKALSLLFWLILLVTQWPKLQYLSLVAMFLAICDITVVLQKMTDYVGPILAGSLWRGGGTLQRCPLILPGPLSSASLCAITQLFNTGLPRSKEHDPHGISISNEL